MNGRQQRDAGHKIEVVFLGFHSFDPAQGFESGLFLQLYFTFK